jgi:hypothetical protein
VDNISLKWHLQQHATPKRYQQLDEKRRQSYIRKTQYAYYATVASASPEMYQQLHEQIASSLILETTQYIVYMCY